MKLHVGGNQVKEGWKLLNIQALPGVDFVGNISDLSQFGDRSLEEVYASHVLEHVPQRAMMTTLAGIYRALKPGGRFLVSVPNMDVLCRMFLRQDIDVHGRYEVMRMMFGGQVDTHDFHFFGWNFEILQHFFEESGFMRVERVDSFGLFQDTSELRVIGEAISLNVIASK